MARPLTVLLAADDPDLTTEWQAAEAGTELRLLPHVATTARDAVALARQRQPDVVCLAMSNGLAGLDELASELQEAAPMAALLGVLDRRQFDSGDAESAYVVAATRAGVRDFLRRPLSSGELSACLERLSDGERRRASAPSTPGRVVCFVSNKGGVGKTTLAVNVACALGRRAPGRVLLVDAALQLGLCATMLDLETPVTMQDVIEQIDRLDGTLLRELTMAHESGLHLLAAPNTAIDAAAVREDHLSRILGVARTAYDFVVVDTFPILDGIAIAAFDRADEVWQVVAPIVPTVLGAERLLGMLEEIGVERERQRLVVNVAVPAHASRLSARDVATRLDRPVDVVVPFSRAAVSACNSGRPVALTGSRWNGFRRRIGTLADLIAEPALVGPVEAGR
ncbi:MAG: AAA family ATPase [Planctomycetota bacterium]